MRPGALRPPIFARWASLTAIVGLMMSLLVAGCSDNGGNNAYNAPGLEPMTLAEAEQDFYRLAPALLLVVYDAFGRTGEDEIYDTLARVADGEALEALYLERIGAMAGGGLEEEADQTIHEIKLLATTVSVDGEGLRFDASWQVIGTVGHAEHLHVRGNTYRANLTVAPVDNAWKITDFQLLDVIRDAAGETFEVPERQQ